MLRARLGFVRDRWDAGRSLFDQNAFRDRQLLCGGLGHPCGRCLLKEGRKLLLAVRETPLHLGHLELMRQAACAGAVIFPPVPIFYGRAQTVQKLVEDLAGRILLRMRLENEHYHRWSG